MMKEETQAARLINALKEKKRTIGFAESCTGGLCAAALVAIPGASEVFYGSIVSYDNSVKENLLSVPEAVLQTVGAVSAECAMAMARGARQKLGTSIAVSVTGIAGPGGGTPEKPVGTVYIGVDSARGTRAQKLSLGELGDRKAIRKQSVLEVLRTALEEIESEYPVYGGKIQ